MALALHGEDGLAAAVAGARALELGRLLDHGERGVEALVAQDGGDVLQAGHRVAQLGAGQPVDGAGRLNGVDGLAALQPDRVEVGQVQLRDQLWHGPPLRVRHRAAATPTEVSGARAGSSRARRTTARAVAASRRSRREARGRAASLTLAAATRLVSCARRARGPVRSSAGRRLERRGGAAPTAAARSDLGARWASPAAARFAVPGITTARPGRQPLDRRLGHVGRRDPHELGQRLARLLVGHARRLGEARLDRARAQRGDGDARAAQLGAERAPVGEDEGLRRAVAGLSRQRLEGCGRRRVEDRARGAG